MIQKPMDVAEKFPVRRGKRKKQFRLEVANYLRSLGYACKEEKGSLGSRNIVAGDPKSAKYLVTAHYDTCATMFLPNLITPRNPILYFLYQMLIVAILFLPCVGVGILVRELTGDHSLGFLCGYGVLLLLMVLMYAGPANRHNANDNTSGVVALLEIAASVPEKYRGRVCFVLFDLEEAGLVGSASYHSIHKADSTDQLVFNLDCVGDGDEIFFFPNRKLRKDENRMTALESICGTWGKKSIILQKNGWFVYPSDQSNFRYGIGICAVRKNRLARYIAKIHTFADKVLDETNINILRASIVSYITCTQEDRKENENETL